MKDAMMLQAIQHPTIVGGQIIETIVKPDGILIRSLGRLPERKPVLPENDVKLPAVFAKHLPAENSATRDPAGQRSRKCARLGQDQA